MIKQNTTIKLRSEQMEELKQYGVMGDHWPDVIEKVLKLAKLAKSQTIATSQTNETHQTNSNEFNEATIDKYGKASISRKLAGKIVEWRVKE